MEVESNFKNFVLIGMSFFLAMMLTILPLPQWAVWLQPAWVFMVLLFWMMTIPHRVGIGIAFITGFFLDLLSGTVLGQHALLFTVIAYFMIRFRTLIYSLSSFAQQSILVLILTVFYLALQYWIMAMLGVYPRTAKYWLSLLSTVLLWPWLRFLLQDYHYRFKLG